MAMATLDLEALFIQLFPEKKENAQDSEDRCEPFTLDEIAKVLTSAGYGVISDQTVRRAWKHLLDSDVTYDLVKPIDSDRREFEFMAKAARRIARRAVRSELPVKYRNSFRETRKRRNK